MATSDKAAWQTIQSKLMALGYGSNVVIGEPRSGEQAGTIAVIPLDGEPPETVLSSPRETHRVNVRMYQAWMQEPQGEIEFELDKFRAEIWEDICGDFDIGGNVAYILPTECAWNFDEAEVGDTLYRVVNIMIAYTIDDNATFVE